jgi:DNA-binding IclR family transcriptional regulator
MKMTSADGQNETRYNIRVLDRAFRILALLSDGKPRSLQELSQGIELSTSTTFRLMASLSYYRFVRRDEQTNQYTLGLACLELARAYQESNDLRRMAQPELEVLRDDVKETVHLAILDQMEIVYLEKLPGLHAIGLMSSRVGGRSPAYCTGVGKVLLAYQKPQIVRAYFQNNGLRRYTDSTITTMEGLEAEMESIRAQGYGFDRGEHEHEVRCVATPIFDLKGDVVAAISISGPAGRMEPLENNREMIQKACQTATNISTLLGYNPSK